MAATTIQLDLHVGEVDADGVPRYAPGDEARGRVTVFPGADLRCNHLYVRAQWRTEGRGDRDEGRGNAVDLFQGTLSAGQPASYDFRLPLPAEPWSYAGHYINIVWELVAEVDVPLAPDLRARQTIVVAPPG
jgi:hypothetical protein